MVGTTGDYASTSYGQSPTICYATVTSIDDGVEGGSSGSPRNRVRCRIHGYQNDRSTIPDEGLQWFHCVMPNSQMHGHTKTQPYYVGAKVVVMMTGATEGFVMGAVAGHDSSDRMQGGDYDSTHTSEPNNADVPNVQISKGQYSQNKVTSTIRSSDSIVQPPGGLSVEPFKYAQGWQGNIKPAWEYATGMGAPIAPYGKGLKAQYGSEKGIGYDRTKKGEDVLDFIKQKDNNQSGVIKNAIDNIKSLRMNGYGTGNQTVGQSLNQQTDQAFMQFFGIQVHYDILNLLLSLQQVKNVVIGLTYQTFLDEINSNELFYGTALFQNVQLAVDTTLINDMFSIKDEVLLRESQTDLSTQDGIIYLTGQLERYKQDFKEAMYQAVTSIFTLIDTVYGSLGDFDTFVNAFGGQDVLGQIAFVLQDLYSYCTGSTIMPDVAGGALNQALNGTLPPPQPTKMTPQQQAQSMDAMRFQGNQIALGELFGGGKNPEALTGIMRKYQGADDPNHRNNAFKTFPAEGQ